MASLFLFELKKMLARRTALVANVGVVAFLVGIMVLNVVQTKAETPTGDILSGPAAISQTRERAEEHAGPISAQRAASDIAAFQDRVFEKLDREEVVHMTNSAVYDLMFQCFGSEEVYELYNPYWSLLLRPWRVTGEEPVQTAARVTPEMAMGWYDAASGLTQADLDDGQGGMWEYSRAEREYWSDMRASVLEPIEFGYAGGWQNIIDCAAFLVFPILAMCVTLAPVFSFEYQSGADAVVLATRCGRSTLIAAKIAASLVYVAAYFLLCSAVIAGFSLVFYGTDGFGASIQSIDLSSPYPITAGWAAFSVVGLMCASALGFACLTLALSSRTRSTLAVFLVDVVLVLITGLIPAGGVGILERMLAVFPLNFANFSVLFSALDSYPLGPFVFDLPSMIVLVYACSTALSIPTAISSFRRHQVA